MGVELIAWPRLALAFLPVAGVLWLLARWSLASRAAAVAVARMVVQLLLVGYVLTALFSTESPALVLAVLGVMLVAAGWIALQPLERRDPRRFARALAAIALGGTTTLVLVTVGVLQVEPWYAPRYLIPLGGMIFANAMNAVSLAAERLVSEIGAGRSYLEARPVAMRAAMIPQINTLVAVGLVALPGMMTGQILSGVEPLQAVRYQIMVMAMIFGSGGMSAACYLLWSRPLDGSEGSN